VRTEVVGRAPSPKSNPAGKNVIPKDNSADALQTQVNAGQVAAEYLRRLDPRGAHNLVAFDPTSGGPSHGRTFAGGAFVEIAAWVNEHDEHFNLYYTVNEVRPDFQGVKPTKDDIVSIRAVFADADPEPGDLDAKRVEVLERLQGINALADADLIDSGGGFQLIVMIEEKLPVDALSREWAESYGRGLAAQLGSDAVQNIDRLMRLPGAMNIPTPSKRAKGRVARRATVLRPHARTFPKAEIDGAVMPKKQARAEGNSPHIAEVTEQIRNSGYTEADTFEQLPAALQEKFRLAVSTDPELATLWIGKIGDALDRESSPGNRRRYRLNISLASGVGSRAGWALHSRGIRVLGIYMALCGAGW
jgi:hypothetical protein